MSRVVKYRVWDSSLGTYDDSYVNRPNGVLAPIAGLCMSGRYYPLGTEILLEQWTGLLDKAGTEIYEGDIIQHVTKVEHGDAATCVGAIEWNPKWCLYEIGDSWITDGDMHLGTFVVLGNVHQHPDLLKP